jgi:glucose/arabinose dehydrogenase
VHSSFGRYTANLTQGHNADFERLVAANLVNNGDDAPPAVSSATTPVPSSSLSIRPTSIATTATHSGLPGPVQTDVPASCNGVANLAFPLRTAKGWRATKVAGGLTQPRGLAFDSAGNLLVVQNGLGITAHRILRNGCLEPLSKTVIAQRNLNHGIVFSQDGKILYASSATSVFAWTYDVSTMSVSGNATTIVTGMDSKGHVTRSLAIPPRYPDLLLISHGSNDNIDFGSIDIGIGRACIKVFDTKNIPPSGYDYGTTGSQMGYGLRNEVGLAFDAASHVWGVENSADELHRIVDGVSTDIHNDNPADELNYIGDPSQENKNWYGYPTCFTVFSPSTIPGENFTVGDQFVLEPNATFNDATCKERSVAPRVALPAHSTPLDAKFNTDFSALYVTLHGSWNRNPPVGFKVIQVPFGQQDGGFGPTRASNATEAWNDVLWNERVETCSTTSCFRPVGMVVDRWGRVYVSSDSPVEGEVVVLGRE